MGLLAIIAKIKQKEREARVLLLGLDGSGKSTCLKRLLKESLSDVSPTMGFDIRTLAWGDIRLNVWDIGGQETIRAYWRNYFEETDAVLWVVDSGDRERLEICRNALREVLREDAMMGASVLVFANKQDLDNAMRVDEVGRFLALASTGNRNVRIQGCSALTGEGLSEGIDWLAGELKARVFAQY